MAGDAHNSDLILRQAGTSLVEQRAGGRRRSIGQGSAAIKTRHFGRKLRNIALAVVGIWVGLSIVGGIISGIGFAGLAIGAAATVVAVWVFSQYPRLKVPSRADINPNTTDVQIGRAHV